MMTFILLALLNGAQTKIFVAHEDLSRFDGLSLTTSAQPTPEREQLQDELFSKFYRFDLATNRNVPALHELPEYHGLPEPANHQYKVIKLKE